MVFVLATPGLLWGERGWRRKGVAVRREAFGSFHRREGHKGEAPSGPAERGEPGSSAAAPSSRGPEAAAERRVPLPDQRGPDSVSRGASRRPPRPMRTFVTERFREPFVRSHRGGRSPPFLAGRRAGKWGGGPPGKGDAEGPAGGGKGARAGNDAARPGSLRLPGRRGERAAVPRDVRGGRLPRSRRSSFRVFVDSTSQNSQQGRC